MTARSRDALVAKRRVIGSLFSLFFVMIVALYGVVVLIGTETNQSFVCDRHQLAMKYDVAATGGSLWPPGQRCTFELPNHKVFSVVIAAPMKDTVRVGTLAAGAALLPFGLLKAPAAIATVMYALMDRGHVTRRGNRRAPVVPGTSRTRRSGTWRSS